MKIRLETPKNQGSIRVSTGLNYSYCGEDSGNFRKIHDGFITGLQRF